VEQLLWFLLAGTRGGANRLRILDVLIDRPTNANQLARQLDLDYRTVHHHLEVLVRNRVVVNPRRDEYGSVYFVDPWVAGHPEVVARIRLHLPARSTRSGLGEILAKTQSG
jgi:DNA-binding transcriptional ArsR family regulator